jgi:hypothetical protein
MSPCPVPDKAQGEVGLDSVKSLALGAFPGIALFEVGEPRCSIEL